jgi:hypothetical protein
MAKAGDVPQGSLGVEMSADNWTTCPKCKKEEGLREDYEIGILDGEFYIIYSGSCSERHGGCGWEFKFRHNEKVKP